MDTYDSVSNEWLEAFNAAFMDVLHSDNIRSPKRLFLELCVFYNKMNHTNLSVVRHWLGDTLNEDVRADDMGWDIDDPMLHSVIKSFMRL
jgi:hypothetical protein